jgi:energy-dependent translational throttle protein EttA
MAQYVCTMRRVGKVVPPKRVILKNISLNFFAGAKIGVLGLNGSGKSSVLRIMAGIDKDFDGEASTLPNLRIGYLAQEPQLDAEKDVRGNVLEGLGDTLALVEEFNAISERFAEPMEDEQMNRLLEQQGELQAAIDAVGGWEIERKLEVAADALERGSRDALGGRTPARGALPAAAL